MPFINSKFNFHLENQEKEALKTFFGTAINTIPGKTESWLMVNIDDNQDLYFQGKKLNAAYVEIKMYGNAPKNKLNELTSKITTYLSNNLDILPSRIYVSYFQTSDWGWSGNNF